MRIKKATERLDNVSQLLDAIIEFTVRRRQLLLANIEQASEPCFVPKDLPVAEFSEVLEKAVASHICSKRLVFCDSENVTFGHHCSFNAEPLVDRAALELFENDFDRYLELQARKLSENSLNNRIAHQLLEHKNARLDLVGV